MSLKTSASTSLKRSWRSPTLTSHQIVDDPPGADDGTKMLIDTSAFSALSDTTEHGHGDAQAISRRLAAERWRTFTTNFVVAEAHALHLTRGSRAVALTFLERLQGSQTVVVRVSERDERRAMQIIRQYDDKDFSFTDATSFAVMERLRIGWAFSFDRDFAQYGFPRIGTHESS